MYPNRVEKARFFLNYSAKPCLQVKSVGISVIILYYNSLPYFYTYPGTTKL